MRLSVSVPHPGDIVPGTMFYEYRGSDATRGISVPKDVHDLRGPFTVLARYHKSGQTKGHFSEGYTVIVLSSTGSLVCLENGLGPVVLVPLEVD